MRTAARTSVPGDPPRPPSGRSYASPLGESIRPARAAYSEDHNTVRARMYARRPMLNRNSKARRIRRVAFFSDCSKDELDMLAERLGRAPLPAGTAVGTEGGAEGDFYVIVSGVAEVFEGDELIRTMGPGECFGEVANVLHRPRSATVRASSAMQLLVSDEPGFFDLIHGTKWLHGKVID